MPEVTQRAFAAGEISPALKGRADMVPYGTGLNRAKNMLGKREGGIMNRPGTKFIRAMKVVGTKSHRFSFNDSQSYHLEFGVDTAYTGGATVTTQGYIRFTYRGATLVLPAGASVSVPAWSALTVAYDIADLVSHGVRHYYCQAAHTSSAGTEPGTAGGEPYWYLLSVNPDVTNGSIYEIPTPYTDIDHVWYTYPGQSADVMVVAARVPATVEDPTAADYPVHLLRRFGHVTWDFVPAAFAPDSDAPVALVATVPSAGTYVYRYKVTATDSGSKEESLPGPSNTAGAGPGTLQTGATYSRHDIAVASTAHGFGVSGVIYDGIFIKTLTSSGVLDPLLNAILLEKTFRIQVIDADHFALIDTATLGDSLPAATHTITWAKTTAEDTGIAPGEVGGPTKAAPNTVTWTVIPTALNYSIYREETDGSGNYGFLGLSSSGTFKDDGTPPDMSEAPPTYSPILLTPNRRPGVVSLFDQRLCFAATNNEPLQLEMSRAGDLFNFTTRSPIQDDDAIKEFLAVKSVAEIRHMTDLGDGMLLQTAETEGLVTGEGGAAPTPTTIHYLQQGFRGASRVFPLQVDDVVLYTSARGNEIFEIHRGDFGGYVQPIDPAIFSSHLWGSACGCSPVAMAWEQRPDRVVWVVRSDGAILSMVFLPNHSVRCWSWGETQGLVQHHFKDVVVVPEGSIDTPYFTVSRTIDGTVVEYLEAMVPRCEGCSDL